MQPTIWKPPIELSKQEEQVVSRIRRANLFVFLRNSRHELFDEPFQQELANLYRPTRRGHPPITPAQLALATLLQAYTGVSDKELHIDWAYLSSHLVRERRNELEIYCKAWPVREGKYFSKQAFTLDWDRQIIRCPAAQEMPFVPSDVVHFPKDTCAQCQLKTQCTTSAKGRSVSIHPDEALLIELRQRQRVGPHCASGSLLSIRWLMWVGGKADAPAIADCAKISLICVGAQSSTICTSWLILGHFKLIFRRLRDYSTGSLDISFFVQHPLAQNGRRTCALRTRTLSSKDWVPAEVILDVREGRKKQMHELSPLLLSNAQS